MLEFSNRFTNACFNSSLLEGTFAKSPPRPRETGANNSLKQLSFSIPFFFSGLVGFPYDGGLAEQSAISSRADGFGQGPKNPEFELDFSH